MTFAIHTASGRCWPLLAPTGAHVHWPDIAEALASMPRFNGHTAANMPRWSVAEHCLLVADFMPAGLRGYGLLHDAHEAFTGDIISPVKAALRRLGGGDAIDSLEQRTDMAIYEAAGLAYPLPPEAAQALAYADAKALATERRDLLAEPLTYHPQGWKATDLKSAWGNLPPPSPKPLRPQTNHHEAAIRWLDKLENLCPQTAERRWA